MKKPKDQPPPASALIAGLDPQQYQRLEALIAEQQAASDKYRAAANEARALLKRQLTDFLCSIYDALLAWQQPVAGLISEEEAMKAVVEFFRNAKWSYSQRQQEKKAAGQRASGPSIELLLRLINDLDLSVRTHNCLKLHNFIFIGDVVQLSEKEMLRRQRFGRKALNELREILREFGLDFGMRLTPETIERLAAAHAAAAKGKEGK